MSSTGSNSTPVAASFPIPPPVGQLPHSHVGAGGQVYWTPTGWNFIQKLWAAIQGGGGIIDLVTLFAPSPGAVLADAQDAVNADVRAAAFQGAVDGQVAALRAEVAELRKLVAQPWVPVPYVSDFLPWTPTLAGSGTPGAQTYGVQTGALINIGPLSIAMFSITLTALDVATAGDVTIAGLPYPINADLGLAPAWISAFGNMTVTQQLGAWGVAGASALTLVQGVTGIAAAPLPAAALSATSQVVGGVAFFR